MRAAPQGRFTFDQVNGPFERLVGVSAAGCHGRPASDVMPQDTAAAFDEGCRECQQQAAPHRFDTAATLASGPRTLRVTVAAGRGRGGGAQMVLFGSVRDISNM